MGNQRGEMLCTERECYLQESDLDSFRDIVVLEMIGIGLLLGMAIRFLSLGDRENCVAFFFFFLFFFFFFFLFVVNFVIH